MPDRMNRRGPGSDVVTLRSRKGFSYLAGGPRGRRIGRHGHPDQLPSQMAEDHQAIQQLEQDGSNHE